MITGSLRPQSSRLRKSRVGAGNCDFNANTRVSWCRCLWDPLSRSTNLALPWEIEQVGNEKRWESDISIATQQVLFPTIHKAQNGSRVVIEPCLAATLRGLLRRVVSDLHLPSSFLQRTFVSSVFCITSRDSPGFTGSSLFPHFLEVKDGTTVVEYRTLISPSYWGEKHY